VHALFRQRDEHRIDVDADQRAWRETLGEHAKRDAAHASKCGSFRRRRQASPPVTW
jgi:hypothetical protein